MAVLTLSAYIINTNNIPGEIVKEFSVYLDKVITNRLSLIKTKTNEIISKALRESETWRSVESGELQDYFKIPNGSAGLSSLEDEILASTQVDKIPLKATGGNISGGLVVNVLSDTFGDITFGDNFVYYTLNGVPVSWMNWLLFEGSRVIYPNAKLIQTTRGIILVKASDNIQVPARHAGTANNNFVTRALAPLEPKIGQIIEEVIVAGV